MQKRKLGQSDLEFAPIAFGGNVFGWTADEATSHRILDAFVDASQEHVTGEVRLKLEPNRCYVVGRRAPRSLYDYGLATYDAADRFRHADSEGFVRIWGLGVQTWSGIQGPGSVS